MARILVVDDDPDFVEITRVALRKGGHEVVTASTGPQSLLRMREQRPDVVLLDIMMSFVVEGLWVGQEMRADPALKDIPIIIVSSLTGVEDKGAPEGDQTLVDAWLSKPVNPTTLLEQVNALLATRAAG